MNAQRACDRQRGGGLESNVSKIVQLKVQDLNIRRDKPVGEFFRNCPCKKVIVEVQTLDVGQLWGDLACEKIIAEVDRWDIDLNLGYNGSRKRVSLHLKRHERESEQDGRDAASELIGTQIKIIQLL